MGWRFPPFYGKKEGREEKRIAKINRKIAELTEEKAIYEEKIANRKKENKTENKVSD